jgi:hypothetical protein
MIDLEFYGKRFKPVTDSWKTYLDHLASFPKEGNEAIQQTWEERRNFWLPGTDLNREPSG